MFRRWFGRDRASAEAPSATHATVRVPANGLKVVYAPDLDGDPDPGEVVWAWIPYEDDPKQGKDRPAIVIGWEDGDVVVVPLTTKPHPERDDEVEVGSGGWDRTQRVSYAKVDDVLRVRSQDIRREGAVLDRKRFERVVRRSGRIERPTPATEGRPDRAIARASPPTAHPRSTLMSGESALLAGISDMNARRGDRVRGAPERGRQVGGPPGTLARRERRPAPCSS